MSTETREAITYVVVGLVCIPLLPLIIVLFVLGIIIATVHMFGVEICDFWDDYIREHTPFRRKPWPPAPTTPEEGAGDGR